MMMVKEVIIYSSLTLAFFFLFHSYINGKFDANPVECRADQFCGAKLDAGTGELPGESPELKRQEQGLSHRQWLAVHSGESE
jgi:hypothetical protein